MIKFKYRKPQSQHNCAKDNVVMHKQNSIVTNNGKVQVANRSDCDSSTSGVLDRETKNKLKVSREIRHYT